MNIGKNLRAIRDSKKLSQQEVADYVGVERKTYMNWETDGSNIKSVYIPQLAEFFKVEIKDLFKEDASNIVINQNNTDNKDNSVNNSIVVLLNDKEAIDEIANIIKGKIQYFFFAANSLTSSPHNTTSGNGRIRKLCRPLRYKPAY